VAEKETAKGTPKKPETLDQHWPLWRVGNTRCETQFTRVYGKTPKIGGENEEMGGGEHDKDELVSVRCRLRIHKKSSVVIFLPRGHRGQMRGGLC